MIPVRVCGPVLLNKKLLVMKLAGFTKSFRKNVCIMMKYMDAGLPWLDRDGPEISDMTIRLW
jgi:hypothetical protein